MSGCCLKIKEMLSSLPLKEQQIAMFILDFPQEVINMSIDELASACGTSISSVVWLCKSAGYSGYKELCRMLSTDLAMNQLETVAYNDVRPGDSVEAIYRSVCMSEIKAVESTMAVLNLPDLERAVDLIADAKRVDFYGIGTSGLVALDARNKFLRINKTSLPTSDPHDQILTATTLKPGDIAVMISYTGDTRDILETADIIRQTGATIISITRYSKNMLAQRSDVQLYASSSETLIRSGAMGSRIALLTIIDVLYTCVASRDYDKVKKQLDKTRLVTMRKHVRGSRGE